MENIQRLSLQNKSKMVTLCLPLNDTHWAETVEMKFTPPAAMAPSGQIQGRKKSVIFRLTHEDMDAQSTDKIWLKSNFEDEARETASRPGKHFGPGAALYLLPKMKPNALKLSRERN